MVLVTSSDKTPHPNPNPNPNPNLNPNLKPAPEVMRVLDKHTIKVLPPTLTFQASSSPSDLRIARINMTTLVSRSYSLFLKTL